ncbi:MAG TPA: TolC family protein [Terriglobales bacterium]|jgi:outer membrane protein TolC|nr:TolC family protein [Terriglobales bacterium]
MSLASCLRLHILLLSTFCCALLSTPLAAEPVPLRRVVELALNHSTTTAMSVAAEQRAYASYDEIRDHYLPSLTVGSGLGATWGYPLSLEGSAPSIINTTAQSALVNPALREFVREAKTEWQASTIHSKDQRDQIILETVLNYAELSKWEALATHLTEDYAAALKMEEVVNERIKEGVDTALARDQVHLSAARVYLHISQAQGAIDVLRSRLSHVTGLAASSIETIPDSIPALPDVKQADNLAAHALEASPAVQVASLHSDALALHARGEHRSLWPSADFAAQYALLATFNHYQDYFVPGSFQKHNATIGVVIRFPFFNPSQRDSARAADAEALRAKKQAEEAKNQVSEQTLKLQRSVQQLAAAQEVVELEYQIAKSNLETTHVRVDAGSATLHEENDARSQASEHYAALQDAKFQLEQARIALLRQTGDLAAWVGVAK